MANPLYDPPTRTPTPAAEAFAAVEHIALGLEPALTPPAVRLLQAMLLHEGWAWNHNCGGCKAARGARWTALRTHEVVPDAVADRLIAAGVADEQAHEHPHLLPGTRAIYFRTDRGEHSHPATWFAAFHTFAAGAESWLRRLLAGGRYDSPALRTALGECDPAALAERLKRAGYYTSAARAYAEALAARLAEVPEHRTLGDNLVEGAA